MTLKFDTKDVENMFNELEDMPLDVLTDAFKFYKKKTPVRSGNARSKTKLRSKKIKSEYSYASKLDEGWSKQAPQGMSEPTIDYIENQIEKEVQKIGR